MLSVRRSHLEEFRKVLAGYGDEARLVRTLQGSPDPPNWRMEAGTAWHACLEDRGELVQEDVGTAVDSFLRFGDYCFCWDAVEQAQQCLGPGLFEVPSARVYDLGGRQLDVTCTCDHIRGLVIQDNKTCFDAPDPRDYESALQWRFYLCNFEASAFIYRLWHFHEPDRDGFCRLKDLTSIRFWRYPGLEAECAEWCRLFLEWVEGHNLLPCLESAA